jgi:hypothetical protein
LLNNIHPPQSQNTNIRHNTFHPHERRPRTIISLNDLTNPASAQNHEIQTESSNRLSNMPQPTPIAQKTQVMVDYFKCCKCEKSTMIIGSATSLDNCDHFAHLHCKDCGKWGQVENKQF